MSEQMVVIGAGPGGYVAAVRAAQMGAHVTLVERDNVGGTCLNWGCVPSKIMKATGDMLAKLRESAQFGIEVEGRVRLHLAALMERKRRVIDTQATGIHKLLARHKVRYLHGGAVVQSPTRVLVEPSEDSREEVPCDKMILALGSEPADIPSMPFDGQRVLSSNDVFNLEELPGSMLIVGGGVIGCEFANIFSSLGCGVTIVEALSRLLPLPSVDDVCSITLQRELKKRKIPFFVDRAVERIEEDGSGLRVTIGPSPFLEASKRRKAASVQVKVDKVLVCIGRKAVTPGIGLDRAGVHLDPKGWIKADEGMRTNIPGIYAIGDALGPEKVMLAHVASTEALVAAENAMGERRTMKYDVVPGAVFTSPEIACVGLTEQQARAQGQEVRCESVLFRSLAKAQVLGEIAGEAKIVSEASGGRILGVHMVGAHATDLIAEGTLAVQCGCTLADLAGTIHAHPTLAEIMMEVSHKALGTPVHG